MSVGNKIKALRLQRGMTQGTLAEGIITRGMLSRIESGSANPSMASLAALAERLDVSPSFLLESGDDLLPAERMHFEKKLAAVYKAGDKRGCLALFSDSPFAKEEPFVGVYIHTAFSVAVEEFERGNFRSARSLLDTVDYLLPTTIAPLPDVSAERIAFLRTAMEHIDDPDAIADTIPAPDYGFPPSLFYFVLKFLKNGNRNECAFFLKFGGLAPSYRTYIEAQLHIRDYNFIDALLAMKGLIAQKDCPCFLALLCYASMENCSKLCEDYKGAYENHISYHTLLESIQNA